MLSNWLNLKFCRFGKGLKKKFPENIMRITESAVYLVILKPCDCLVNGLKIFLLLFMQ